MEEKKFRVESDLLGELQVPEEAYYGVQTQRAINNYHISRKRMCDYPDYVVAIAYVKLAAVETNRQLGEISDEVADAMAQACREIIAGKMHENFVTDMVQGGAGTWDTRKASSSTVRPTTMPTADSLPMMSIRRPSV